MSRARTCAGALALADRWILVYNGCGPIALKEEITAMSSRSTLSSSSRTLVEGQRLDQPTFHALYEAMPPGHKGRVD